MELVKEFTLRYGNCQNIFLAEFAVGVSFVRSFVARTRLLPQNLVPFGLAFCNHWQQPF